MKAKCKSLRIKERQLRNKQRKNRKPQPFLWFKFDPDDHRQLILSNGTRLRQAYDGVGLFLSQGGNVYALTQLGLRNRRVNFWKKNNYCKRIMHGRGRCQGQCYPYVHFHEHTYRLHQLMACAWLGGIPDGMVPDHINGNIDDFRTANLRVITVEENNRCGGILKRLRAVAIERNDPALNPLNMKQKDLLDMFKRLKGKDLDKVFTQEVERYRTLVTLRHASAQLHDPSLNPDNMEPERREMVLSKYRVGDPAKIMEDDFKYHREF